MRGYRIADEFLGKRGGGMLYVFEKQERRCHRQFQLIRQIAKNIFNQRVPAGESRAKDSTLCPRLIKQSSEKGEERGGGGDVQQIPIVRIRPPGGNIIHVDRTAVRQARIRKRKDGDGKSKTASRRPPKFLPLVCSPLPFLL